MCKIFGCFSGEQATFKLYAANRVNKMLPRTLKSLKEIQRLCSMFLNWIALESTVLLILEQELAMSKQHQPFLLVLKLPKFLTLTLLMGALLL